MVLACAAHMACAAAAARMRPADAERNRIVIEATRMATSRQQFHCNSTHGGYLQHDCVFVGYRRCGSLQLTRRTHTHSITCCAHSPRGPMNPPQRLRLSRCSCRACRARSTSPSRATKPSSTRCCSRFSATRRCGKAGGKARGPYGRRARSIQHTDECVGHVCAHSTQTSAWVMYIQRSTHVRP